jgi:cytochrome P450
LQAADGAEASKCPFLAALPPPPTAAVPWWQRIKQFRDPPTWQKALLSEHDVVQTPAQMGFPAMVLAGRADLVQKLLTGEGDITRTEPFFSLKDLLGPENIGFAPDPEHGRMRRLLAPAFAPEAVYGARFLPEIVRIVGATLDGWADACEAGSEGSEGSGGGGVPGAYPTFKKMTFRVIMGARLPFCICGCVCVSVSARAKPPHNPPLSTDKQTTQTTEKKQRS